MMFNRLFLLVLSPLVLLGCPPVPRDDELGEAEFDSAACPGQTVYADADGDGFGDAATGREGCIAEGLVDDWGDCNDADAAIHPGAAETACNGLDDDCSDGPVEHYLAGQDLQAELDAVSAGELACIPPGDYAELSINGQLVTAVPGSEAVTFHGSRGRTTVEMACGGLSGVTIDGGEVGLQVAGECAVALSDLEITGSELAASLEGSINAYVARVLIHDVEEGLLLDRVMGARLEQVRFENASSSSGGPAMRIVDAVIIDTEELSFEGNEAGALWIETSQNVTIEGALFRGNRAEVGGGLHAVESAEILVTGSVFEDNIADIGGGVLLDGVDGARLEGLEIRNNEGHWGGGLFVYGGDLVITESLIEGNVAIDSGLLGFGGGALAMEAVVEGDGNEWSENVSENYGGGLAFMGCSATLRDWIEDNRAGDHGGGIFVDSSSDVDAVGSAFDGNAPEDIY